MLFMVLRCCKVLSGLPARLLKTPWGFAVTKQILGGVEEIQRLRVLACIRAIIERARCVRRHAAPCSAPRRARAGACVTLMHLALFVCAGMNGSSLDTIFKLPSVAPPPGSKLTYIVPVCPQGATGRLALVSKVEVRAAA